MEVSVFLPGANSFVLMIWSYMTVELQVLICATECIVPSVRVGPLEGIKPVMILHMLMGNEAEKKGHFLRMRN